MSVAERDPSNGLSGLFSPSSICVVGASPKAGSPGGRIVERLSQYGFDGTVSAVNPRHERVNGVAAYPLISDVPHTLDSVVIALPRDQVLEQLELCANAGAKSAIVISSGFSETKSPSGIEAQNGIARIARTTGMRVLGPNSVGFFNVRHSTALTFNSIIDRNQGFDKNVVAGSTMLITQSGGIGFGLFVRGVASGLKYGLVAHTGNEADVGVADCLWLAARDEHIESVVLFIEAIRNVVAFRESARAVREAGKTIIVIMVGTSPAGRRAADSHTAHLAGDARIAEALFCELGILRASDHEEVVDLLMAVKSLGQGRRLFGRSVGIVTTSGGAGVWLADGCVAAGLSVPEFDEEARRALVSVVPEFGSAQNPVDLTAAATAKADSTMPLAEGVITVSAQSSVDQVMVISPVHTNALADRRAPQLTRIVSESMKPVSLISPAGLSERALELSNELSLPMYASPYGAARAVNALLEGAASFDALLNTVPDRPIWLESGIFEGPSELKCLGEAQTKAVFAELGFKVPKGRTVSGLDGALEAANEIGFPVALKAQSPAIPHKSAVGGLALNVRNAAELSSAFARVSASLTGNGLECDEWLIEEMVNGTGQYIVGGLNREDVGSVVLFGSGGTQTESKSHALLRIAPLTSAQARVQVKQMDATLVGEHHSEEAQLRSMADLVWTVSWLIKEWSPYISQMELNPVTIDANSGVPIILDALLVPYERAH